MHPDIAVVVVNWNKKADVLNLLNELRKVTDPLFDIFVVDNASTDGSTDAIGTDFPDVNLIMNRENLGGTGGFNTGIDYVCKLDRYNYIWLLDNDASITGNTLSELINVIKSDDLIGIVGSHIKDIDNKGITVELGANIRWDRIGTNPVHRNATEEITHPEDVDYVAICSALVSVKALKNVGLMDSRLFLLWDDMDWGLCFKDHGYKVIAASKSVVYHGSFTERDRGAVTNFYYGIRNPLLVYSKHASLIKLSKIFYRSLKSYLKNYFFLKSHHKKYEAELIYKALSDFMNNRWGKFSLNNKMTGIMEPQPIKTPTRGKDDTKKILISSIRISFQECMNIIKSMNERYPDARITILVRNDRVNYYKQYDTHILNRIKMENLFYAIKDCIAIKRKKFDAIAYTSPTPFGFLGKSSILCDKGGQILSKNYTSPLSLIKIFLLICFSELVTFIILPVLLYKSLKYKGLSH